MQSEVDSADLADLEFYSVDSFFAETGSGGFEPVGTWQEARREVDAFFAGAKAAFPIGFEVDDFDRGTCDYGTSGVGYSTGKTGLIRLSQQDESRD